MAKLTQYNIKDIWFRSKRITLMKRVTCGVYLICLCVFCGCLSIQFAMQTLCRLQASLEPTCNSSLLEEMKYNSLELLNDTNTH